MSFVFFITEKFSYQLIMWCFGFSHVGWGEVWGMSVFSLFVEAGLGSAGGV